MIVFSIVLIVNGIIYIYAEPYQKVKIYEYQGWLIYMHAAKHGMYFFLATFFLLQILFPFLYCLFLVLFKLLSLVPHIPDIAGNLQPFFPIKNHFLAYENPIKILSNIIEELMGSNDSSINHYITSLSFFAFLLSFLYSKYLSYRYQEGDFYTALIEQYQSHSPIDSFIIDAFYDEEYILITLDTNKIYVGMITSLSLAISEKDLNKTDITMLIYESGYRDSVKMEYEKTNNYQEIYSNNSSAPLPKIVISRDSIVSISNFEPNHYYQAFEQNKTNGTKEKS